MSQEQMPAGSRAVLPVTQSTTPNVSAILAKANKVLNKVRVVHGSNEQYFELSGKQVGSVRKSLREVFNIPNDALAYVNGEEVKDDFVLESGSSLEFSKTAGVKGINKEILMNAVEADYMAKNRHYDTRNIDGLFLELSQFTKANTRRELELIEELAKYQLYVSYLYKPNIPVVPPLTFEEFFDDFENCSYLEHYQQTKFFLEDENMHLLFPNKNIAAITSLKLKNNSKTYHYRVQLFNGDREMRIYNLSPEGEIKTIANKCLILGEAKKNWSISALGSIGAMSKADIEVEVTGLLIKPSVD